MTVARATFLLFFMVSAFTLVGARLLSAGAVGEHHPVDGYGITATAE
ncbi:hypothetical protein [Nitratireductor indicus]|nr:hypothetical protein [Nitratireductor indicus]MDS1138228.1 hypothetical protein [Nitratireductor indicus]SFQ64345.1 hypothetical protein SAMN05216176_108125 [Nitratireductor indicus]